MINESQKIILITVLLSRLIVSLDDKFFRHKLFSKMQNLLDSYIEFKKVVNVAQYKQNYFKLKNELDNVLEIIDFIIHSGKQNMTPLLRLKRRVLNFKLSILKSLKRSYNPVNPKEERTVTVTQDLETKKPQIQNEVYENKSISSKDKILDFIRKSTKIRTKDLIEEFSAFSERTVKRTLKDLTDNGIVKREELDRAVYYSIAN